MSSAADRRRRDEATPPAKRSAASPAAGDAATGWGDDEANAGAANASTQTATVSRASVHDPVDWHDPWTTSRMDLLPP